MTAVTVETLAGHRLPVEVIGNQLVAQRGPDDHRVPGASRAGGDGFALTLPVAATEALDPSPLSEAGVTEIARGY